MSQKSVPSPKPADYAVYAIYRVFETGLRLLPLELVWTIGYVLGPIGWVLMPQRRRTTIRNLRIVFGKQLSHPEIRRLAFKAFCHAGANLMSSFRSTSMSTKELRDRVFMSQMDKAKFAEVQSAGGILLIAHMGNWEVLAQLPVILDEKPPIGTLYRPLDNPLIDRLIRKRRQRQGVKTFSRRDGFFKPISHLKEGGFLGTIADQHAGRHGMSIPLFGKLTSITNLPSLLHRRSGAPIIPIAMCTTSPGRWKLEFLPIVSIPEDERKNTLQSTHVTTAIYQKIMLESPSDVIWMHGYWKVGRKRPLNIDGMQKESIGSSITQPFRVVVYTGNMKSGHPEITEQLERLRSYRADIHLTTLGAFPAYSSADHSISCHPDGPPHLISNTIRRYDLESPAPIDCALDFTEDGSGGKLLIRAGLDRVFCRQGKWLSKNTRLLFSRHGSRSLALFLTSLGLKDDIDAE